MIIFSLLLLGSQLPHLTCIGGIIITNTISLSFSVNVGIVNGKEAKPHSRPYMVSVQTMNQHICGGFLISKRFVMTAAQCRKNSHILTVVLGAHDLKNGNEKSVRINVDSYYPHPHYTSKSFHNDILLLKLEKEAQLNNNIKVISIPEKEGDIEADSVCSIAGWGLLETNGKPSNHLMETDVKVMNNKKCESKWGEEDFSASLMMCVYGDGGSCDGDSGGPLVCGDTAVGVTSFAHVTVGIVNGKEAEPHSRPPDLQTFHLNQSVQMKEQHICNGFLISDKFVMTAARCRNNSSVLTVVLGAHDLPKKSENSVRIKVDSYHYHPDYTSESFHNDILLLKLETNAQLNDNIKGISIPVKEGDIEAGSDCSIAGWGFLETNGKRRNHLMETNVTVMNNKKCESELGKDFLASQMMCVYSNGGSCNGDSGGPLVCGDTAVGVTSFDDVYVVMVNGKEAKPHSRPYMVSVQMEEQHICSGFLISDRFVMTAAHCRNNSSALTVVLGAHDLRKKSENSVRIKVDSYHPHPDYTSESFHNDILLLKTAATWRDHRWAAGTSRTPPKEQPPPAQH
ncbi:hypothetical protein Q8A67_005952 [Cirrhinus molitorella]|uniref:trypsin n=1 Tax=Cirrhinus molitorella TaxID=172907 RepID=A0AA88TSB1_9TELE|nr:hypothetical protein Q8A67_005952 [Cirrhinus molitorella]